MGHNVQESVKGRRLSYMMESGDKGESLKADELIMMCSRNEERKSLRDSFTPRIGDVQSA